MTSAIRLGLIAAIGLLANVGAAASDGATTTALNVARRHLRSGNVPEWDQFAATPDGRRLDLSFRAEPNDSEATLFVRQDDVRQDWGVELNGRRIGRLFEMEADLVHAIRIPPHGLRDGTNVLSIVPPRENDDIIIGEVWIEARPLSNALAPASLRFEIRDEEHGSALPARITVVCANGALAPLLCLSNEPAAVRPGVVYTAGRGSVGLPAGDYTIYASRGPEWSVATQRVHVAVGVQVAATFRLRHELPLTGWAACDTHVHTFTYSRHGDCTLDERMLTLAGEGIDLPIATDHNVHVGYSEAARRMGVTNWVTPVMGNEVTTQAGHFNIFPVDPAARVADFHLMNWPDLMTNMRATPGVRVVILNHPRNVHNGFQPFAATNFDAVTGENKRGPEFTFDAMEVLNSSAQQSDYMLVFRDWFALLNHGYRVTAVGSSDCHDVSRYIVGQGRTYLPSARRGSGVDINVACANLLRGRALVSLGLIVDMTVDGRFGISDLATGLGRDMRVAVRVLAPSWMTATNVTLYANGVKLRERALKHAHQESVVWTIPRPSHDVYLVAIATGPGVAAPFWAIPRPYQPLSPHWEGRVIGSTNPIWIDGDGDGRFTSPRAYARTLVESSAGDPTKLAKSIRRYDNAVATQAKAIFAAGSRIGVK